MAAGGFFKSGVSERSVKMKDTQKTKADEREKKRRERAQLSADASFLCLYFPSWLRCKRESTFSQRQLSPVQSHSTRCPQWLTGRNYIKLRCYIPWSTPGSRHFVWLSVVVRVKLLEQLREWGSGWMDRLANVKVDEWGIANAEEDLEENEEKSKSAPSTKDSSSAPLVCNQSRSFFCLLFPLLSIPPLLLSPAQLAGATLDFPSSSPGVRETAFFKLGFIITINFDFVNNHCRNRPSQSRKT